jgi:hypothetical protein
MLNRRGRNSLTIIFLLMSLMICTHTLFAAAPVVTEARYIDAENILEITFDQPVYNDSLHVIRGGISLDGDNGGPAANLTLTGGSLSGVPALSPVVPIKFNYADQQFLETMTDKNSLELVLVKSAFINEGMEGNPAIGIDDNVTVSFVDDSAEPAVVSAAYNAGTNQLKIELNQPVNGRQVELTRILIDDDNGGPRVDLKFSSLNERMMSQKMATVMEIALNPKHQQLLESFNTGNLFLVLNEFAFINEKRNSVMASATPIAYTADSSPFALLSADYDGVENNLTLTFNKKVITTFWEQPAINFKGIAVHDGATSETATLSGATAVSVIADNNIVINVLPADQRLIENLTNKNNLYVTIEAFAVLTDAGNGIRPYTSADNLTVAYHEETETDAPTVTEANYNAAANVLTITFGNISPKTKGIDTTSVDLTGVVLDDDDGGPNADVLLSGGEIHGIKSGVPKFVRQLQITVNQDDEIKIESLARKDHLSIGINSLSFFFESYTKTRNGNHKINVGTIPVTYLSDAIAPEVIFAKYDFIENQIIVRLDKLTLLNLFTPAKLTLGGIRLTGGEIVETSISKSITIKVNEADQASLEGLANSIKQDLSLGIDKGALANLDNVQSEVVLLKDGDKTSAGEVITVGYGRGFWDRSFEAFRDVDHLVETSLRGVGEHCYVFVADTEWTVEVTKDVVDNVIHAFDSSTPADPNKGIYQICHDVFGVEKDTDGDPRINLVFFDIRDEYGKGRNDRYSDLPKAGYFDTRDLSSIAQDPHSNTADIIYIDTDPVISAGTCYNAITDNFQRMVQLNVDPNEEQWLVEGLSTIAEVICGYGFVDYKIPTGKPSVPFKTPLTSWTGWQAGKPSDLYNLHNVFLFTLYLYEQFGGTQIIKALAADKENGLKSLENVFKNLNINTTISQLYDDFAVACFKDKLNHPVYGNKYGFLATDTQLPGQGNINWDRDEVWDKENQWSYNFYKLKTDNIPKTFLFNGNDKSIFSIQVLESAGDFTINKADGDSKGQAQMDLSGYKQDINIIVCSKSADGPVPSPYVLSRDTAAPKYVNLGIFQNPSVERNVDIYIVSKERLFLDIPTTDPNVKGTLGEGPEVTVKLGKTTKTIIGERSFADSLQTMYQYRAQFNLWDNGNYSLTVKGQDMTGNVIEPVTNTISVKKILASDGGSVSAAQNGCELSIAPNALKRDVIISCVMEPDRQGTGGIYRFGPAGVSMEVPALLKIYLDPSRQDVPAVYQQSGSTWQHCESRIDPKVGVLEVRVDRLGEFKLAYDGMENGSQPVLPTTFNVSQNYPNPFNATTTIEYQLPERAQVSLILYNMIGQRIAELMNQPQNAGFYTVNWDAKECASGIYYYVFTAGQFKKTSKMLLIK